MSTQSALIALLTVFAAVSAKGSAFAADDSQAISTAPAMVSNVSPPAPAPNGPEISAWGRQEDDGSVQSGTGAEPSQSPPRQVHGEVSAGFGSGGYTGVSGIADVPIGQSSDLVMAGSRQSFGDRRLRGSAQSLSVGLFLNGAAPHPVDCALPSSNATPAIDGYGGSPSACGPGDAIADRAN